MNVSLFILLVLASVACGQTNSQTEKKETKIAQKDTCDDPDASIGCCFSNVPSGLTSTMTINPKNGGEKLIISGTLLKSDGRTPYPNATIYAYHTDSKGYYSKRGDEAGVQKWHGHLYGWCKSDEKGNYIIQTIRPAPYPDGSIPAHIHAAIKTNSGDMYWISDFVFKDDPLVNAKYLSTLTNVGGTGVVDVTKKADNVWRGERNIVLK